MIAPGAWLGLLGGGQPYVQQFVEAVRCVKALLLMTHGPSLDAKRLLDNTEDFLATVPVQDVQVVLQALFARASARHCELMNDHGAFYDAVFAFATYGKAAGVPILDGEMTTVAYKAAMAALLAPRIHNFGRLLTFAPFADALEASTSEKWVYHLCKLCNSGDVDGYTKFVADNAKLIGSIPDLHAATQSTLPKKVRLMALLHLCFHTSAEQRTFPLSQIGQRCNVAPDEVEPLLLQAFALRLIEGKIDGLKGEVEITWVQARVLSVEEIAALADRLAAWRKVVADTVKTVEEAAKDIPS